MRWLPLMILVVARVAAANPASSAPAEGEPVKRFRIDLAVTGVVATHVTDSVGDRLTLDRLYDSYAPLDHTGWSTSERALVLEAEWRPRRWLLVGARLPLVQAVTHGVISPGGVRQGERFDRTAPGDVGLTAAAWLPLWHFPDRHSTLRYGAAVTLDLPTGPRADFAAKELSTGAGGLGCAVRLLQHGEGRGGRFRFDGEIGELFRRDTELAGMTVDQPTVSFAELRLAVRLGRFEVSLAGLGHQRAIPGAQPTYGDFGGPTGSPRSSQATFSLAPAVAAQLGAYRVRLELRAPRLAEGLAEVSTGIIVASHNDLSPTFPPLTLAVSREF